MRDIRARIAQRSGVDLSNQQIQELAARRLEAILDPRGLKPGLLDQLRRSAGERVAAPAAPPPQLDLFEESTLYDSPNGLLRFIRRLLNPILRLFFNPTPIAHALAVQGRLNAAHAAGEAERDRRQSEWNALHYEILQRLVTEIARVSIEIQSLSLRVESLSAKVDFNERRVRSLDGAQVRAPRPQEAAGVSASQAAGAVSSESAGIAAQPAADGQQPGDAPRRRRRRRRGRRGTGMGAPADATAGAPGATTSRVTEDEVESGDADEGFEDEPMVSESAVATEAEPLEHHAVPEAPVDHRLPEPAAAHSEAPPSADPSPSPAAPRDEAGPGNPEE